MKTKGQSLVEMLIIIAVLGTALTAMVAGVTIGISNTRVAYERNQARQYAEEKMETIKALRDADSITFFSLGTRSDPSEAIGVNPEYTIDVDYLEVDPGQEIEVTVSVSWEDSGRDYSFVQETTLSKWE